MSQLAELAGRNCTMFRRGLKLSQVELAKRAKLSRRTIFRIEHAEVDMPLSTLERLARGLEIPPDAFLKDWLADGRFRKTPKGEWNDPYEGE